VAIVLDIIKALNKKIDSNFLLVRAWDQNDDAFKLNQTIGYTQELEYVFSEVPIGYEHYNIFVTDSNGTIGMVIDRNKDNNKITIATISCGRPAPLTLEEAKNYTDGVVLAEQTIREEIAAEDRATAKDYTDTEVASEKSRAEKIESDLQSQIDSEIERSTESESDIATNLASEISRATQAELELETALSDEVTRATAAEFELQKQYEALESEFVSTIDSIHTDIDALESAFNTDLQNEIDRASAVESALTTDLQAESERASKAEEVIAGSISNEVTRASTAEVALSTTIDNEISRASGVEADLQTQIGDEESRATTTEGEIWDALNTEIERATTIESGKVDKEDGKVLSSEDYTSTEKSKLAGLENYILPGSVLNYKGVYDPASTYQKNDLIKKLVVTTDWYLYYISLSDNNISALPDWTTESNGDWFCVNFVSYKTRIAENVTFSPDTDITKEKGIAVFNKGYAGSAYVKYLQDVYADTELRLNDSRGLLAVQSDLEAILPTDDTPAVIRNVDGDYASEKINTEITRIVVDQRRINAFENGTEAFPYNTIAKAIAIFNDPPAEFMSIDLHPASYSENVTLSNMSNKCLCGCSQDTTIIDGSISIELSATDITLRDLSMKSLTVASGTGHDFVNLRINGAVEIEDTDANSWIKFSECSVYGSVNIESGTVFFNTIDCNSNVVYVQNGATLIARNCQGMSVYVYDGGTFIGHNCEYSPSNQSPQSNYAIYAEAGTAALYLDGGLVSTNTGALAKIYISDAVPNFIANFIFDEAGSFLSESTRTLSGLNSYMLYDRNQRTGYTTPEIPYIKGHLDSISNSLSDLRSIAQGALKTPLVIANENSLPSFQNATVGDYYVVQEMNITAPNHTGRIWKGTTGSDWQRVVDDYYAPDEKTTVLNEDGYISVPFADLLDGTTIKWNDANSTISAPLQNDSSKLNTSDVIDNLTSTATTKALSAYQGKVLNEKFGSYVIKDGSKVLSDNNFTSALLTKLDGIAEKAEVNVNADWNATTGDSVILNKPTIPEVNNATLTLQKNGSTISTFTANASTDVIADFNIPTKTSEITNDAGFITIEDIPGNATDQLPGLMSASDKTKLDGIATGANKYTHPTYTSYSSGLYKVTVNSTGHVSAATTVAKSDITALGIPGQDTTYSTASTSTNGLMSSSDKIKLDNIGTVVSSVSLTSGTKDGTLKLTVSGTATDNIAVKGLLGSAYKDTSTTADSNKTVLRDASGDLYANVLRGNDLVLSGSAFATPISSAYSDYNIMLVGNTGSGVDGKAYQTTMSNLFTQYSIPQATSAALGGVKITGTATNPTNSITSGADTANKNYAVKANASGTLYCSVPWSDTNTTYSAATTSASGLMSSTDKSKLDGVSTGAQVNVLESIKNAAGTALTISSKAVTLSASAVGLGNVANVLQYSAENLPPAFKIEDTRAVNSEPSFYMGNKAASVVSEIKQTSTIGVSSLLTHDFCTLITVTPWADTTGSAPFQIAVSSTPSGGMAIRSASSSTAWNSWGEVYTSLNKPTASELGLGALASLGTSTTSLTAYLRLTGGTLTGSLTSQAITPSANNSYSCGTSTYRWSYMYGVYMDASSDVRLKKDITPVKDVGKIIDSIDVFTYRYKKDDKDLMLGISANDLKDASGELWETLGHTEDDGYLGLKENKLVYLLLAELKEQKAKIRELEERIQKLESNKL
jgi:hypothetical protein